MSTTQPLAPEEAETLPSVAVLTLHDDHGDVLLIYRTAEDAKAYLEMFGYPVKATLEMVSGAEAAKRDRAMAAQAMASWEFEEELSRHGLLPDIQSISN